MSEPEPLSQILAKNRSEMDFDRTMMAYERTLMAWIRTTLSLVTFGFTIYKFLDAMQEVEGRRIRENAPFDLGLFLILIGMSALSVAIFQYKKAIAKMASFSLTRPPVSISLWASYGVLLVGSAMLLNMPSQRSALVMRQRNSGCMAKGSSDASCAQYSKSFRLAGL